MPMFGYFILLAILLSQGQAAKEQNYCAVDDHGTPTPGCTITNGTYGCPDETQFLKWRSSGFCCCNCPRNRCTYKGNALANNCHRCPSETTLSTPRTYATPNITVEPTPANTTTKHEGNRTSTQGPVSNATTLRPTPSTAAITSTRDSPHRTSLPVRPTTMPPTTTPKPVENFDWRTAFILLCVVILIALLIWLCRARLIRCICKKDGGTNGNQGNEHVEGSHGAGATEDPQTPLTPENNSESGENSVNDRLLPDPNADNASRTASDIAHQHNGRVGGHQGENLEATVVERISLTSIGIARPGNPANGQLPLDSNADNTSQTSSDTGRELETGV